MPTKRWSEQGRGEDRGYYLVTSVAWQSRHNSTKQDSKLALERVLPVSGSSHRKKMRYSCLVKSCNLNAVQRS